MQTPVIVTVYDAKMKLLKAAVVEYEHLDRVVGQIKETCEKNQWTVKCNIPPTEEMFILQVNRGL